MREGRKMTTEKIERIRSSVKAAIRKVLRSKLSLSYVWEQWAKDYPKNVRDARSMPRIVEARKEASTCVVWTGLSCQPGLWATFAAECLLVAEGMKNSPQKKLALIAAEEWAGKVLIEE
jgi:hypothetical protein